MIYCVCLFAAVPVPPVSNSCSWLSPVCLLCPRVCVTEIRWYEGHLDCSSGDRQASRKSARMRKLSGRVSNPGVCHKVCFPLPRFLVTTPMRQPLRQSSTDPACATYPRQANNKPLTSHFKSLCKCRANLARNPSRQTPQKPRDGTRDRTPPDAKGNYATEVLRETTHMKYCWQAPTGHAWSAHLFSTQR